MLSEIWEYIYDVYDAKCVTVLKSHQAQFYIKAINRTLAFPNQEGVRKYV